ncbi:MAG: carbohydrate ABC transporter permease [Candidatus Merdivicinus sp.]|jgi:putative aldouronate transport system permease protein
MKMTKGERVFDVFNTTVLILFAAICVYPFIYVAALSFNDGMDAMKGGIYFFPREFTLDNYRKLFEDKRLLGSLMISIFRTLVGGGLAVLVNALYAFAISKSDLPLRKLFNWMIVIPMYFGGGLIPYYLVCRSLHLTNTIWVYVIPWLATPFHVMLLRISMKEMPDSLEESAQLDGAGYGTIFFRIILPLCKPALATVALLGGITHWNDWLDGTIMVFKSSLWPMQTLLLSILQGADMSNFLKDKGIMMSGGIYRKINITPESLKMAMLMLTVVPVFMIYPFAQRYFIKGMMIGSVKG